MLRDTILQGVQNFMETKLTFDAHLRIIYFMKEICHVSQKYWLEYVNKSIRHKIKLQLNMKSTKHAMIL